MKSRASVKSHPLHPVLIAFPIAFLTATFVLDCYTAISANDRFLATAYYLNVAGVISGLLAAVPGLIDYIYVVPPKSSAKKRATKHALSNVTMLVLFSIAFFMRPEDAAPPLSVLGLELVAILLMGMAGWMGGTLVYRNLIGVDMRYANAGKWKEQFVNQGSGPVEAADINEVQTDQMKLLHVNGKRIVIAKTESGFVAFDDRCTHRGGSLAGGSMICSTVQCPWHGSQFDVQNGSVKAGPAKEPVKTYPISISNGKVYVDLSKTN